MITECDHSKMEIRDDEGGASEDVVVRRTEPGHRWPDRRAAGRAAQPPGPALRYAPGGLPHQYKAMHVLTGAARPRIFEQDEPASIVAGAALEINAGPS